MPWQAFGKMTSHLSLDFVRKICSFDSIIFVFIVKTCNCLTVRVLKCRLHYNYFQAHRTLLSDPRLVLTTPG